VSAEDARRLGLANGALATVSAAGISAELRVRVSRTVHAGIARVPEEHAKGLQGSVQISAAGVTA
jgi:anaerobic selenocysteine-containing dehydrogenase